MRAARGAFDGWSTTTPAQRSQALLALADLVEEHGEEIARLEALNAGKPIEAVTDDEIAGDGRQPALLRGRGALTWRAARRASTWRATPRSRAAKRLG